MKQVIIHHTDGSYKPNNIRYYQPYFLLYNK